ncbi:MAG: alanine racemase [Lachnospiraceae bacterium]
MNSYLRVHATIDLDAIKKNMEEVKKAVGDSTKVMAIIKADGYGHGSVACAKALRKMGVDAFGVAIIEEGVILRKNGIKQPILILGYTSEYQMSRMIQYQLTQTVFELEMAKNISKYAVALNKKAKIHIKIDTGMNRIGFKDCDENIAVIKEISKLPNIEITGAFTHFARADEKDKKAALKQLERYTNFVNKLEENGIHIPTKHISNSAGIIDFPQARFDMVRSGIMTYGLYPSDEVSKEFPLYPAFSLKSHIIYLKEVEEGEGISYNHIYVTKRKSKIATIPVGYADGYPRALSSKGRVLIRGQYAPIVGRICMDQFMVDVTDIEGVSVLDDVTLVGKDGENTISVEEVANMAGSFNYEFVCGISKRVPRVYIEDGEVSKIVDYMNA